MNPQQKKLLWIAIIVVAVFYVAPSFLNSIRRAVFIRQQPAAQAARQAAARPTSPLPASSAAPGAAGAAPNATAVPAEFNALIGVWQGASPLPGQGVCNLRLELRKSPADPARFAGFPVLACMPALSPLTPQSPAQVQSALTAGFTPMTAVLSGAPQNGAIQFTVDKVIGKTPGGCAMTSFTVTPYGNDLIAAEWQDGLCPAGDQQGHILLKRVGR
jgi:hypothetical protein